MKDARGSMLIIVLGFMVIFTSLGLGYIHLAGVQNEMADKQLSSLEAFWLADGMVERARKKLPNELLNDVESIDNFHFYNVVTEKDPDLENTWKVTSRGIVRNQKREIEAVIVKFDEIDPGSDDEDKKESLDAEACVNEKGGISLNIKAEDLSEEAKKVLGLTGLVESEGVGEEGQNKCDPKYATRETNITFIPTNNSYLPHTLFSKRDSNDATISPKDGYVWVVPKNNNEQNQKVAGAETNSGVDAFVLNLDNKKEIKPESRSFGVPYIISWREN